MLIIRVLKLGSEFLGREVHNLTHVLSQSLELFISMIIGAYVEPY
jgi:hypothetical protein